ncbi:MAG: phosphatase PAP2 family protein, partial [Balneolaceae bacterium]
MSEGKIIPEFADKNRNSEYLIIDTVTLTFLTFTGLLLVIFSGFRDINYFYFGTSNLLISAFIFVILKTGVNSSFKNGLFRILYPLLAITLVHVEVELFIEMIYGADAYLDHIVLKWDAALFGVNPHLYFQNQLPQLYWNELFHLLYIFYYPLLFGSLIWVWNKRRYDFPRFVFIYLGLFFTFVVIFSLFPVIGPLYVRDSLQVNPGVISRFVDFLFLIGAPDGAAFPSSHVG